MIGLARFSRVYASLGIAAIAMLPTSVVADAVEPTVEPRIEFDCTSARSEGSDAMFGAVTEKIARKWNLPVPTPDLMDSQVTVRVCFSADGRTDQLILIAADGPNSEAIDRLFQTARRAILRVDADGGLPLPPEKYDTWRVLDLVFDANGMRAR